MAVTAPGKGSWVDIKFFANFLQSDLESMTEGIFGLFVGWGLFLVVFVLSEVVGLVFSAGIGLAGLTGDVNESVVVEEARDMESESDLDSEGSGEAWR